MNKEKTIAYALASLFEIPPNDDPGRDETEQYVIGLMRAIGFGRAMQLASEAWSRDLDRNDLTAGGAFSVGPCKAELVDCDCIDLVNCDWCAATGKVTAKVLEAKKGGADLRATDGGKNGDV